MKRATAMVTAVVIVTAVLAGMAGAQNAKLWTGELGETGEVPQWLVLAYIPLEANRDSANKVMDTDLLQAVGGEGKVQPSGGQKVVVPLDKALKLPDAQLLWRQVRPGAPEMFNAWNVSQCVSLFNGIKADAPRANAAHLYCQLLSPSDMEVHLMLGAGSRDMSIKVLLNSQLVGRFAAPLWPGQDTIDVKIKLRKGANDLLVRMDNYAGVGSLWLRLLKDQDIVPREVKVQLRSLADAPVLEETRSYAGQWDKVLGLASGLAPAEHQDLFGAHLARTMSLLETGGQTGRPVRILIYGQSIEGQEWTTMLVERLRERYPNTKIVVENMSIGGWNVWRLMKTMYHDVVRERPDLVTFSAYGGWPHHWERVLSNLRRETCADIMIRTGHVDVGENRYPSAEDSYEVLLLRRMAQKYDCELVECRREWLGYMKDHKLRLEDLLDNSGVHVNDKGNALMAQLYERHFRTNTIVRGGWMNTVRRYDATRPLEDRRFDEITLVGNGWKDVVTHTNQAGADYPGLVESASPTDQFKLKFVGNRVDLVLPGSSGGAKVLIDGKAPSALGLMHGTRPVRIRTVTAEQPANIKRYYEGANVVPETWTLTFQDISSPEPTRTFRFTLHGSVTGEDGQGSSEKDFVSTSGRITILADDWVKDFKYVSGVRPPGQLTWQIVRDSQDEVRLAPGSPPCVYLTVADGLPCTEHELTLIPLGDAPFRIQGVDVFKPPMGEEPGATHGTRDTGK